MNVDRQPRERSGTVTRLRLMLLGVFLLGSVGTLIELLLLGHTEEVWQLIPLALLTVSITVVVMWFLSRSTRVLRTFQGLMGFCLLAGGLGMYLHYQSNVEFELEMNPSARGIQLIWESLTGAMPALAPGTMCQLGLVGLLYTYKHPAFQSDRRTAAAAPGEAR